MITTPAGWTQHFGANLATLYPPGGGGRVRYYERIRPLRSFSRILHYVLDRDPDFRVTALHDPRDVITSEGEYGAWVRVNGVREGTPAVRFVGAIFLDEFAAALDTLVIVPDKLPVLERAAQAILVDASFGLGVRRRRFLYQPPPGWQAIPSGLVANWYPREFPRANANIVVAPAEPSTTEPARELESLLSGEREQGIAVEGDIEDSAVESFGGLKGWHWRMELRRPNRDDLIHREIINFLLPPYSYMLRMEAIDRSRLAEYQDAFLATARSAMPIPTAGPRRMGPGSPSAAAGAFSHWVD